MRLRVHQPEGPGPLSTNPDNYEQPSPIQHRQAVQWTPAGPAADHLLVWFSEDARACRACPLERCSFLPCQGDGQIGTCVIRRLPGEPTDLVFNGEPAN